MNNTNSNVSENEKPNLIFNLGDFRKNVLYTSQTNMMRAIQHHVKEDMSQDLANHFASSIGGPIVGIESALVREVKTSYSLL